MLVELLGEAIRDICHKIILYADDMLVFLSNPETSLPAFLSRALINLF